MKGGYRPGAGRPKGSKNKNRTKPPEKAGNQLDLPLGNLDPLEYLLQVMRDPTAEPERRARAAIACLPFCHIRKGEGGKKDEKQDRAKAAGAGRFRASAPPQLKVVK
jgi:phage terminase small subunit